MSGECPTLTNDASIHYALSELRLSPAVSVTESVSLITSLIQMSMRPEWYYPTVQ